MTSAPGGLMEGHGALHVEYPVSDGEPMAETDEHFEAMAYYGVGVLKDYFSSAADVYVAGNNFLYYEEGNPKTVVSPDTYVVKGVDPKLRPIFKVWEEDGHRPCFVLEVTSKKTRRNDLGSKMSKYRDDLEVPEYFLFDPYGEWIPERVRGFRLVQPGTYTPITANASGHLPSEQLELELGVSEGKIRFYLPGSELPLPTPQEKAKIAGEKAEAAEVKANAAEARAKAAEDEVARLRAELDRLRAE